VRKSIGRRAVMPWHRRDRAPGAWRRWAGADEIERRPHGAGGARSRRCGKMAGMHVAFINVRQGKKSYAYKTKHAANKQHV